MTKGRPVSACCRFIEVVERVPQCPCDCVPPIPTGPPCPFKSATGGPVAGALQSLLQQTVTQESNCPLIEKPTQGPLTDSAQSCVFSRPGPIDFKSLQRYTCTCVPGTCPELAKNFIRSLGFDPMCMCPCPQAVKPPEPEPLEPKKKQKRRRKDRSKSTPSASKTDIGAKSSTDEAPTEVPTSSLSTPGASENATAALPSAIQSVTTGAPKEGLAPIPSAARDIKPVPQLDKQKPKFSDDSGYSNGILLLEGKGFKIFEIDGEKVLINYSTKNCHLLDCKCSQKDEHSCGCNKWVRLTKYCNCVCPGARKIKKVNPVPVLQYEGSTYTGGMKETQ